MCGAPPQTLSLDDYIKEGIDVSKETVIAGTVTKGDAPVSGAYVRLLDSTGEFTAEVVTSATGNFRFFAAPGQWTLRALSSSGNGETTVAAELGQVAEATVSV